MGRWWRSSNWRWLLATLVLAAVAALAAARVAERRTAAALHAQAATDAQIRAALFDSELARFRLLPLLLANDRDVIAAVDGAARGHALDAKLERIARVTGAAVLYVIAPTGRAIASSNWRTAHSFVGSDYRFRPYFRAAVATGAGSQYALGTVSHRPGLYLARRTANRGVIVVKLEFGRIEREWARIGGTTYVGNAMGVVLVTSRPAWRFAAAMPLSPADAARFRVDARLPTAALAPLPTDAAWATAMGTAAVSQPGWRLTLLRPAGAAMASARRLAAISAALGVIALAALGWAVRQRVTLVRQRTAELERAVAERTADLRREMDERADSEARAAQLREGLRQANRLASLGQITASVAHETAQPVAAIRTYAQTTAMLVERGAAAEARDNLATIARLADRIGAVTAQLRGFARRQPGELRAVPLAEVIDGALLILREQLRAATLARPGIDPALAVTGGRVRLEQVLVNLFQNALEAMADQPDRRIALHLAVEDGHVRLTVADNGPGIAADVAERLFTPFVTSRPAGLGLGLVIAQDIMAESGGWLRLVPSAAGAAFEVGMRRA